MQSPKRVEPLADFETDVPMTAADHQAQWTIRMARHLSPAEYLAWCQWLTNDAVVPARDFHTEPFEL